MKKLWIRRILMIVGGIALVVLIAFAFIPKPVEVDIAHVKRGPLQISVNEDGQTRIRERYTISAPLGGRMLRIDLEPGDNAEVGQLLAVIEPRDPELLDSRAHAESEARVESAQSAVKQAEANLKRSEANLKLAQSDAEKYKAMYKKGGVTQKERDDAVLLMQVRTQEFAAAQFAGQIARFQFDLAKAALVHTAATGDRPRSLDRLQIQAPCGGRVLRVFQKSEGFVTAGIPLLEFGDPVDLEAVVDVLSTDAVAIEPGDPVTIEHWGGNGALQGRVRVVEPAAFTKVSSLGVEEQRVNVIIDFVDPPAVRNGLGDGYRVEAAIIIWEQNDVLKVPTSALFRRDQQWNVFRVEEGKAVQAPVTIGRRNGLEAQVIEGLDEKDEVVIYPADNVVAGASVVQR